MSLRFLLILTLLISTTAYTKSETNKVNTKSETNKVNTKSETNKVNTKSKTNEAYIIELKSKNDINVLRTNPEISFDHPTKKTIEVYGPEGLGVYLDTLGIFHLPITHDDKSIIGYPTPEEIDAKVIELTRKYSEITRLDKIGTSTQGRSIYAVKISDNPNRDELEPEVKYIANMHGDEIVKPRVNGSPYRRALRQISKWR